MLIGRFLLRRRPSGTSGRTPAPRPAARARLPGPRRRRNLRFRREYRGAVSSDRILPAAVKPQLRGWLHLGTFPLAVVAGALLTVLAPAGPNRTAVAVFGLSA